MCGDGLKYFTVIFLAMHLRLVFCLFVWPLKSTLSIDDDEESAKKNPGILLNLLKKTKYGFCLQVSIFTFHLT